MKRIEFIAPVESMRGNLSGSQELDYRENNNPAYEAPDGDAHALNYQPRFVGAKRSKDGLKYFSVRTKSTTKLNAKTRMTMALLGVLAAVKTAVKNDGTARWANLQSIYAYRMEHGGDDAGSGISFDKWLSYWLRRMLQYKQNTVVLTAQGLSVTIHNPYEDDADAQVISTKIFVKFFDALNYFTDVHKFSIDTREFAYDGNKQWDELLDPAETMNPNLRNSYEGITIPTAGANPLYNGQPIYSSAGVEQESESAIVADEGYTTIAPQA